MCNSIPNISLCTGFISVPYCFLLVVYGVIPTNHWFFLNDRWQSEVVRVRNQWISKRICEFFSERSNNILPSYDHMTLFISIVETQVKYKWIFYWTIQKIQLHFVLLCLLKVVILILSCFFFSSNFKSCYKWNIHLALNNAIIVSKRYPSTCCLMQASCFIYSDF